MKLGSLHFLNGALCALLVGSVAAACGSDSQHKAVRAAGGGGAGGEGGVAPATQAGGVGTKPQPRGGTGGQPIELGGAGGTPPAVVVGEGGMPLVVASGGMPAVGEGGAAGAPPTLNCDVIVFQDATLDAYIRSAIDKPTGTITAGDVAGLTTISTYGVNDLEGVECLSDLTSLDLGGGGQPSQVSDPSPLIWLKNLTSVDLSRNPLTTLEPLGKLPSLQDLTLENIPGSIDLSPLATAPALQTLALANDTVADLKPLGTVTTLKTLTLYNSTLTLPASIASVKSLTSFDATGVFGNVASLAGLTKLQELHIGQKAITNFTSLNTLVNLTVLDISSTGVTTLAPVAGMSKLTDLLAFGNSIADLTPLGSLAQLKHVNVVNNQVTDLTPLANNAGVATGDEMDLNSNPFDCTAQATNIATMKGRGASVFTSCP